MLICLNAYHDAVVFTLPETVVQNRWVLLIDTHLPLPDGRREFTTGEQYTVTGRSLVVFGLEAEEGATRQVLLGLEETIYEAERGEGGERREERRREREREKRRRGGGGRRECEGGVGGSEVEKGERSGKE